MIHSVTITVEGDSESTPQLLAHALTRLLLKTRKFSPDRRFDWNTATIEPVEPTTVPATRHAHIIER